MSAENKTELMPDYLQALLDKGKGKTKIERLKEGVAAYRILPSFNPTNRNLSVTWNSHWLKLPGDKNMTVQCTLYTAEKYCPICERSKEIEDLMKRAKDEGNKEKLEELTELKKNFSRNKKVFYNAVNAAGDVVALEISKTASDALDKRIVEAVTEKKFDPLSLKTGVWFKFTRTGKSFDTVVEVDFRRTSSEVDGEIVEKMDRTPLKADTLDGIETKTVDIFNPESLWIKTVSATDLANYLRGEAINLPGRRQSSGPTPNAAPAESGAPVAATPPASGGSMSDELARLKAMRASMGQ